MFSFLGKKTTHLPKKPPLGSSWHVTAVSRMQPLKTLRGFHFVKAVGGFFGESLPDWHPRQFLVCLPCLQPPPYTCMSFCICVCLILFSALLQHWSKMVVVNVLYLKKKILHRCYIVTFICTKLLKIFKKCSGVKHSERGIVVLL